MAQHEVEDLRQGKQAKGAIKRLEKRMNELRLPQDGFSDDDEDVDELE